MTLINADSSYLLSAGRPAWLPGLSPAEIIFLAAVAGFALACGVAYVFYRFRNKRMVSPAGVSLVTGLPILANVHLLPPAGDPSPLVVLDEPDAPGVLAFQSLYTSLQFLSLYKPGQMSLLITSAYPGEGKSFIAANLAVALAQAGSTVLLIDANLRRPALHHFFQQPAGPGLSDLLAAGQPDNGNAAAASTFLRLTIVHELKLLPAGSPQPEAAGLLGSETMKSLLADLAAQFDYLLLDSSSFLGGPETLLLTSLVDRMLLVISAGRTRRVQLLKAMDRLHAARANIIGIVLNRWNGPARNDESSPALDHTPAVIPSPSLTEAKETQEWPVIGRLDHRLASKKVTGDVSPAETVPEENGLPPVVAQPEPAPAAAEPAPQLTQELALAPAGLPVLAGQVEPAGTGVSQATDASPQLLPGQAESARADAGPAPAAAQPEADTRLAGELAEQRRLATQAIAEVQALAAELKLTRIQLQESNQLVVGLRQKQDTAKAQLTAGQERAARLEEQLEQSRQAAESHQGQLLWSQASIQSLSAELAQARRLLGRQQEQLAWLEAELAGVQTQRQRETQAHLDVLAGVQAMLEARSAELEEARQTLARQQEQLARLEAELAGSRQETQEYQSTLAGVQATLDTRSAELEGVRRLATRQVVQLQQLEAELDEKIAYQRQANQRHQQEVARFQERWEALTQELAAAREETTRQAALLLWFQAEIETQRALAQNREKKADQLVQLLVRAGRRVERSETGRQQEARQKDRLWQLANQRIQVLEAELARMRPPVTPAAGATPPNSRSNEETLS
ncbi:MAG: polysaccharide biosynthesis tyrosine autokinase [Chloroflexi bacterium]|nr:polysaccharide biosynthesis tyrosine autokinase [Chloroflexota bacterium]MCI0576050.1 polysaccharide biosynthesis tyrosine autokinase [Chloroflexota bacterium]MCI0647838.1 polysaccharide biosynthesis tyrosine autokinase [Chloroflexota bacterium]MCI0727089.1 polysaccharide biosynthesis tyrosine autokinase [Chloroflexota bacterium]